MVNIKVSRPLLLSLLFLPVLNSSAIVLHQDDGENPASNKPGDHTATLNRVLLSKRSDLPAFPYWDHVGMVGLGSGIYLGGGWVMTSAHVGCFPFKLSDGSFYKPIYTTWRVLQNPDGGKSDLAVFRVEMGDAGSSLAKLGRLPIGQVDRSGQSPLVMIGTGFVEKKVSAEVADPKFTLGYQVQALREKRWALTSLEKVLDEPTPTAGGYRTRCFVSSFQRQAFEGQAADGDSGGAMFAYDPGRGQWELVGCIFAVSNRYGNYVPFGARTYLGDLASYRAQLPAERATEVAIAN